MRTLHINGEFTPINLIVLGDAVKMLENGRVDIPTQEQLSDVAVIVSGLNGLDFKETSRFLESVIPFSMEKGVLL